MTPRLKRVWDLLIEDQKPKTLSSARKILVDWDANQRSTDILHPTQNSRFSTGGSRTATAAPSSASPSKPSIKTGSTANSDTSSGGRKPITDTEYEHLRANSGCFYCRKTNAGHLSISCPDRPKGTLNVKAIKEDKEEDSEEKDDEFSRYSKNI